MATFHLSMKIAYSGSTIPHLQYITRDGKYEEKNEDLLYQKTINLPDWPSSEMDFWNASDTYDYRSYRKSIFFLPSEVSRDEQIKLAENISKKSFQIGLIYLLFKRLIVQFMEKNPHLHLIFSERLINERNKGMTKEMFFQSLENLKMVENMVGQQKIDPGQVKKMPNKKDQGKTRKSSK